MSHKLRFSAAFVLSMATDAGATQTGEPEAWTRTQRALIRSLRQYAQQACAQPAPELRARMNALGLHLFERFKVDVQPTSLGGVPATWFTPKGEIGEEVILYLHGGGYVFGSVDSYAHWLTRLALAARRKVVALDYRLAPESPDPAALEDALEAYRHLLHVEGLSHQQLFVAGDSAGGGLVLRMLLETRESSTPLPLAALLLSPWCDLSASQPSVDENRRADWLDRGVLVHCARLYCEGRDPRAPAVSPLFADLSGLPPLLIQYGGAEVLRDECYGLAQRAIAAKVRVQLSEYPHMVHGFQMMAPFFDESEVATDELGAFVRSFTSGDYSRA